MGRYFKFHKLNRIWSLRLKDCMFRINRVSFCLFLIFKLKAGKFTQSKVYKASYNCAMHVQIYRLWLYEWLSLMC